jgi:hypothetical protein
MVISSEHRLTWTKNVKTVISSANKGLDKEIYSENKRSERLMSHFDWTRTGLKTNEDLRRGLDFKPKGGWIHQSLISFPKKIYQFI